MRHPRPERYSAPITKGSERSEGGSPSKGILPVLFILILVVMSSGCIDDDREKIEEQYSKVSGKVLKVDHEGNQTTVRFRVMKLFGEYENEAPNENYSLQSGDRITLLYSDVRAEEKGFPTIEEGDYLRVSFYRNKGEDDYKVKYLAVTSHPYRDFYTSLGLIGIGLLMIGVFWMGWARFDSSLRIGVREIMSLEKSIRAEFSQRLTRKRLRFAASTLLFILFSPYLAILVFQLLNETWVFRWDPIFVYRWHLPYDNIVMIQVVLFLMAIGFLSFMYRFMEQERLIRTRWQKGWLMEMMLGGIIMFQVFVQMVIYSLFISMLIGLFSGFSLSGYPSRDTEFHEVFLTFLPSWLTYLLLGLFLMLHGGFLFHRQVIADNIFTERNVRSWSDPGTKEGSEAFGEFDEEDESCEECGETSPDIRARCQLVAEPPGMEPLSDLECGEYGTGYEPDHDDCLACGEEHPGIWFWCRKRTPERH